MILLAALIGMVTNYLRGQGVIPRSLAALVFASPFIYTLWPVYWAAALAFMLIWFLGFMPGWGRYFVINDAPLDPEPEVWWIDWILNGPLKDLGNKARKFIGMSLRGLGFTVPLTLLLYYLGPIHLTWALSGLLLGPSYALGFWRSSDATDGVTRSEIIFGGVLAVIYLLMLGIVL